jgi:hypothetical protein
LVFFATLLILSIERLAIRLLLPGFFTVSGLSQNLSAMLIGLRFDIVIAATIAVPLIAIIMAAPLYNRSYFQKFISLLVTLVLCIVIFLSIADFYFFKQFGEHLNHKAITYLNSDYVYKIIWNEYPILTITAILCFSGLFSYKALAHSIARRVNQAKMQDMPVFEIIFVH